MTPFVFAPRPASTMGVATRCTARLAWCACALRGGQGAWRAARGASSGLVPPFEGSLARWGVVARWGCSSRACRSLVLDLACWCLQNSDPELSPIYCGSWQRGRVAQSFLARQQAPGRAAPAPGLAAPAAAPLRLRVWWRDVPPRSCCAADAQGPDGEQRRRQQRPGDDRGGGGCLCCCSASLLSQRPTHSACRPGRARPRGPSGPLQLWSVDRRVGCGAVPATSSTGPATKLVLKARVVSLCFVCRHTLPQTTHRRRSHLTAWRESRHAQAT